MFGDGGNDLLTSGAGAVTIHGGDGNDNIDCDWSKGPSELHGDGGKDRLLGGRSSDRLFGEGGNDSLTGGGGRDSLFGGNGDDVLGADWPGVGLDSLRELIDGGSGTDTGVVEPDDKVVRVELVKVKHSPPPCSFICIPFG